MAKKQRNPPPPDRRHRPVAPPAPPIRKALQLLESSEGPFYAGMAELKRIARRVDGLIANEARYLANTRALNTIAARPCAGGHSAGITCKDVSETPAGWCAPCYAAHVRDGGEP